MTAIPILSDTHWHELRAKNVGASEVAALFDLHPQLTRFELWHQKKGNIERPDLSEDNRVFWGQMIEPAIAMGVAKLKGWNIRKVRRYITHPTVEGMGASLDYEITAHEKGPGCLEIKTVDWLIFKGWEDGTPPINYELQLQAQLACTGRAWGCVAVLIGGNDLKIFEYDARPMTAAKLTDAVAVFWSTIRENKPPKPDFAADLDTIRQLYSDAGGGVVDMSEDNYLNELCGRYAAAAKAEKAAGADKDAAKGEILTKIGVADKVLVGPYTISAATVKEADVAYHREAYRNFRLTQKEAKS